MEQNPDRNRQQDGERRPEQQNQTDYAGKQQGGQKSQPGQQKQQEGQNRQPGQQDRD
ncbi:hypothetical protein GCM10011371_18380 [Novosphingobium marinum]|uniref:Uncharacterized protein n=1 Tax=Novosphingobium marinum TaxID=1514948 RepID=A0A7Y9XWY1_9SPHN|nr:hypothetical protein [Novosphingobium marinum]NYH95950.1 hypothetical protein [Novosphingobium marinum]GGC31273.1 hypothetical protein GCM10011371_18380 [Novosphingobium marinum]